MNNKRQTIWLVSMLSLMVILSAYYLFTEDAPTVTNTETTQLADAEKATNPGGVSVTEVDQSTDELTGSATDGTANETQGVEGDPEGISPEDQEVLKGLTEIRGNQLFDQKLLEYQENLSKKAEELRAKSVNTKLTQEETAAAMEELYRLEDMDSRITSLQEKLLQEYDNAVVEEVDTNFKVIVLSDKLEKKQAVNIVEMATKELDVTPDRVSVQYVQKT
ncbi:SpoIIIAH-like family protein [Cohnella luojiensis]|nr:SpoIIIAH-like family protein [Cohnella luojiensis]